MRVRVAGIWRHPKTGIYWFRMAVPARLRANVGKREIKETLRTRNLGEARSKHASKLGQVLALFTQIDAEMQQDVAAEAARICQRGFETLSQRNLANGCPAASLARAEANVIHGMLLFLSFRVRCTWGNNHARRAELELFGETDDEPAPNLPPVGVLDQDEQEAMVARINTFEGRFVELPSDDQQRADRALRGNPRTQGMAYRELAAAILQRSELAFVELEVLLVAEAAQALVTPKTKLYEALATEVLTRLATHRPPSWLIDPPATAYTQGSSATSGTSTIDLNADNRTLEDAFKLWCKAKQIDPDPNVPNKIADEWRVGKKRFEEMHGPVSLRQITRAMVTDFRDLLVDLPSRPKKEIKVLPLAEQAEQARKLKLPKLHPNTVEKNLCAVRSLLQAALEEKWVDSNVAANIKVEGAGYVGDERDYYTLEELALIFSSPLGVDPDACSDTMFYLMVLAALQGGRPGEFCKLKPREVTVADGTPIMRFRRTEGRRQKADSSVRDIPIHWIAVEAGILELAEIRREDGAEWLFEDLVEDKYGDRYKLMSRKINKALRDLGIEAKDKCFYSTRHTAKREARRRRVPEENSDQNFGHARAKTGRKYGNGVPADVLKEDIDELEYSAVDWDAVVACGRARIARLRNHLKGAA